MEKTFKKTGAARRGGREVVFAFATAIVLLGIYPAVAAAVKFEAESGVLGANFAISNGSPAYITITSDGAGGNPGSAARVATFSVTFPSAGTYDLYARVRVGPGGASDDSFFYGNGFGSKSATADADWILVNSVNAGGFTNSSDVVSGNGSVGINVWKWVNLSDYTGTAGETPITFNVTAGNLNQTFQIGARENGFDMDKFVFGTSGTAFTVADLDAGALASNDPVVHLRFDETSGTTATDSSGNGWNGTLINGPTWASGSNGRINNAVSLDGSDDYVTLLSGVVSNLNDFTISVWVKLNSVSTSSRLFDFGTGTNNYMFLTPSSNSAVRFAIRTPGVGEQTISGTTALPAGAWTHVLVTLSGSTGKLYVNGAPVGTNSSMTLFPSSLGNTTSNYIGRSQFDDPYLNGYVDEFQIFNRALSDTEIAVLVAPPSAPTNVTAVAAHAQVSLTWSAVSAATSYNVKRATDSGGPYTDVAAGLVATNYTDYPLTDGTTYYYVVSTRKSVADSTNSTVASATPQKPPLPPPAPTYLSATAGDAQVSLSWTASAVATGYIVSRSTTSGSGFVPLTNSVSGSSFTDTGLVNGIAYYYVVAATNADGTSPNSAPASATPAQTFAQWAAAVFPGQSDPTVIGPNADPDLDGKKNIIEFFAGTSASSFDTSALMSLNADDPGYVVLTLRKSRNLAGVSASIEKSSDLQNWVNTGLFPKTIGQQDGYDIMQVTIPRGTADKLFLRLAIATPPQEDSSNSVRERISINNDWRFMKYASQNVADGLIYDTRSDIVNGTTPLKSYILPSGNDFIKNPANWYVRPAGNPGLTFSNVLSTLNDSLWENLNLPHDWAIEGPFNSYNNGSMGRLPSPGVGWYRKKLDIPVSDAGKSIFLDVDGAMSYAMVWLNGNLVGGWPYGYASWRLDLTPYIVPGGTNQLAIRVDNPTDSSRWYPGGGIHRNVWLTKTKPIHVGQWGTYLTTQNVSVSNATINLKVTIDNDSASNATIVAMTQILALDSEGRKTGDSVANIAPVNVSIAAGTNAQVNGSVTLANPRLWGPPPTQVPNRYVAVTTLWRQGELVDTYETRFGIRSVDFDPNSGIYVNGEHIYVNGVDQHHDLGALGAAFNYRAAQRQLEVLRELGCNAIRMSHNPPAPELLDLCDQMGFLVLDEIFDVWVSAKPANDFHLIYADWHQQDLRAFIRRDRNHPSIIIWSFGNEVGEQYTGAAGAAVGQELHNICHEEDPTRPTTTAINANNPTDPLPAVPDLISLNYRGEGIRDGAAYAGLSGITTPPQYQPYHAAFPRKVVLSSENASALSTRGEYLFPVYSGNSAPASRYGGDSVNLYVSAYELYTADFGSSADKVFTAQDQNPFVAGGFVWSGWDYLGEPTPYYTARSSYSGIIDLAGFKKDRFYLYQSRWLPDLPMAHILPHWTWPGREGQVTPVHVFTSGNEAELFLNGVSLGRKIKGQNEYRLRWDNVIYQPGELRVVAYKNGTLWAQSTNITVGNAAALQGTADRSEINADGVDLSFVTVCVVDANGQIVPRAKNSLTFSISGPGEIVATDNGDPTNLVDFPSTTRAAFNGYCLVIVRGIVGQTGTIQLTAQSASLTSTTVNLQSITGTQREPGKSR
jgi:beta-galactosidase